MSYVKISPVGGEVIFILCEVEGLHVPLWLEKILLTKSFHDLLYKLCTARHTVSLPIQPHV